MSLRLLHVAVRAEHDLVLVRQRTRQIADCFGLDALRQTRLATAVSEVTRNAHLYGGESEVDFVFEPDEDRSRFFVRVRDNGPGIANLQEILSGRYQSETGLGKGLIGARRLVDHFEVETGPDRGTTVSLGVDLEGASFDLEELTERLERRLHESPGSLFGEILQQNQELLQAQNALAEANRALEEEQAAKDRFLAMLGHELRNLLNALRSALEVIRRSPEASTRERMQRIADLQVEHLERLIGDLLDASRILRGKLELQRRPLELGSEIESVVDAWSETFAASGRRLCWTLPGEPVWVEADSTRLTQVLANLISNAHKFTDRDGTVRVDLAVEERAARIRIQDDGCGLDARSLEEIFEPFSQTEAARQRATGGLGLGLAIAKGLVEVHGGRIEATSDGVGRGLRVELEFPTIEPPADTSPASRHQVPATRGKRILLVDDHEASLLGLSQLLEMEGHTVATADHGAAALELVPEFQPEIVLCDLGLPEMDGREVARRMARLPGERRMIAVTGFADDATRAEALEAGFEELISKPIDLDRLGRSIDS